MSHPQISTPDFSQHKLMQIKALCIASLFLISVSQALLVTTPTRNPLRLFRTAAASTTTPEEGETTTAAVDPKLAVVVFGSLAEKYIALDSSGGSCCYSACSDCEYRLPGGGYIMADQSAARPKWIPHYVTRTSSSREHVTKWSTGIFPTDEGKPVVSRTEFCTRVGDLVYAPPLGGPYVAASAATKSDTTAAAERFFDLLSEGKDSLTRNQMSRRLKELADGEEGMTWAAFQRALQTS